MNILGAAIRKLAYYGRQITQEPPSVFFLFNDKEEAIVQIIAHGVVWHHKAFILESGKLPIGVKFWINECCKDLSDQRICAPNADIDIQFFRNAPITDPFAESNECDGFEKVIERLFEHFISNKKQE